MRKCCFLILFVFGIHSLLRGSETISFKHLSIKNGLSSNQIHSIFKGPQGYIWFATDHGLARYDGNVIKSFFSAPNDPNSLAGNQIRHIGKWIEEQLLIETTNGYSIYDPLNESFNNQIYKWFQNIGIPDPPHFVRMDSRNKIWIAAGSHCYSYNIKHKRLRKELSLSPRQGTKIVDLTESRNTIVAVTDKGLLVGIYTKKGKRIQMNHVPSKEIPADETEYRLFIDSKGRIWKYSVKGISLYPHGIKSHPISSQAWFREQNIPFTLSPYFFPRTMEEDEMGRIWVGTDREGIYILDENKKKISQLLHDTPNPFSLAGNSILTFYKDDQGIMWTGTYKSGVSFYGKSTLKYHTLLHTDVTSLCQGENDEIWLGTDHGKLMYRAHSEAPVQEVLNLPEQPSVVSLLYTRNKDLWIGTYQGGLYRYRKGELTHYGTEEGFTNSNVCSLVEDRNGQVWIGTLGGGLHCFSPQTNTFTLFQMSQHPALDNNYITSLCHSYDGTIWGVSSTSLFTIDPEKETIRIPEEMDTSPFLSDGIHQVYEDSRHIVWLGTNRGLWAFPPNQPRLFWDTNDGLPQDQIHGITEDQEGTLWIATAKGIVNIQLSSQTLSKKTVLLFNYYGEDALVNSEPNLRALLATRKNEIMSGNISGLTLFHPRAVKWGTHTPKPVLTSLSIGGQEVKVGRPHMGRVVLPQSLNKTKEIKLRSSQNMFSLTFSPMEYNLPKKPDFIYQLEGVDKHWIRGDSQRPRVSYAGLSPGKYRLKIQYLSAIQDPGTCTTELLIRVRPPFYHSGWAFIFYFFSIGIIGWFAILWLRHKKQLQTFEIKQKRDAQFSELMQRFFTSISHDLRTPLTLIITPLEALLEERKEDSTLHSKLSIINRNAKRLMYLVNELLDFKHSERNALKLQLSYGDMGSFLQEITEFFVDYAHQKKISFRIHTEATSYPLLFDKDKLTKAVTNLLANAFKFTPENGQIVLSLTENKNTGETYISVIDSGIGIPIKDRPKVFDRFYQIEQPDQHLRGNGIGLSLVKEFIELHGGTVQISDGYKGTGTCFTLTLPASLRPTNTPTGDPTKPEKSENNKPVQTLKEKLLIVDDNIDFLDFLSENLSGLYQIQTSTNGRKAWNSILKDPPHLIISDVMMPEMDGNDLCRLVKHHRLTCHIPFILLTAKNSEESRIEGLTSGADEYLTKPFNLSMLKLRIFKFLEWSRSQTSKRPPIEPEPEKIVVTSTDEQFIQNAVKYVENHIDDSELSVNEMGKHLCLSRAQLYKKMTALTGRSPIEFIRIIRIKRAHQLLSCSKQSVAEIAYQVGFNNPKYFSQYFKEEYGISPSDFRKRQSEE